MPNGVMARNGGRWGIAALVAIVLLGLGLRVGEAWDGRAPVFDAAAYAAIARNLDEGHGFTVGAGATQPSSDYSPGLPLFVAGIYKVTGGVHERLARLVLALLGTLAVVFTYLIARRLAQPCVLGNPEGDKGQRGSAAMRSRRGGRRGADRGARRRDLSGDDRVHGDADDRAVGGDAAGRGDARDLLGRGRRSRSGAGRCRD